MISVEEKLGVFTQYLLKKQREWGKQTINAAKDKRLVMVDESTQKLSEEKRNIEERSYHVIFRDKNKIIAQGKNIAKTQFLEERSKILVDFNQTILEEAKNYIGTETYQNYLIRCIHKIPEIFGERKDLVIFAKEDDKTLIQKNGATLLKNYTIRIDTLPEGTIGGIVVRDKENRINCDFTVENLIRDHYKLIGMRLNEVMEKQVG
ncbi:MAG: V-type ATP synthase subunit E family protein [Eubacterium sp.]